MVHARPKYELTSTLALVMLSIAIRTCSQQVHTLVAAAITLDGCLEYGVRWLVAGSSVTLQKTGKYKSHVHLQT